MVGGFFANLANESSIPGSQGYQLADVPGVLASNDLMVSSIMDTDSLLTPLERVLSQSQALLSLAQAGDWESFEPLVQQRQQCLLVINDNEYLESLGEADLVAQASGLIREIQAINQQLAQLAESNRDQTASNLRQNITSIRAINAYSR